MPVTELDPAFLSPESLDSPCFVFLRNKTQSGRAGASAASAEPLGAPSPIDPSLETTITLSNDALLLGEVCLLKPNESMGFYIH